MTDDELFAPDPELIHYLLPYLERWSGKKWDEIQEEVKRVEAAQTRYFSIVTRVERTTTGDTTIVIEIMLGGFHDWSRGYFYVPDGVQLVERPGLELRQVDDHFYLFSFNM